jgi:hypothetical protein
MNANTPPRPPVAVPTGLPVAVTLRLAAGLGGVVLGILGVLLPFVSGGGQTFNYWFIGILDGRIVLSMIIVSAVLLVLPGWQRALWITGSLTFLTVLWDVLYVPHELSGAHVDFGPFLLLLGAAVLFAVPFLPDRRLA